MATTAQIAKPRRGGGLRRREAIEGYLFIAPWIIGFLVFILGPMLASFYLSFTNYNIVRDPKWLGLDNYIYILTKDKLFLVALQRTAIYAAGIVGFGVVGSLLLAILLDQKLKGTTVYRTLFFLPSLTPIVASALLWGWIFQPQIGVLNYLLGKIGIDGPGWLATYEWAIPSLLVMGLWTGLGGQRMIIFLAGLQGVPQELFEAASIDGANVWHRFRHITLPMITPTIFFNLVLSIISSLGVFSVAYVATNGGPANATYFYVFHLYNRGFKDTEMGYASALAWIFFAILLVFTFVQFRLQRYWVYYGDGGRGDAE